MAFKGKLIGALLGSFAGPFGTILGGLIGHLFDKAQEEREYWRRLGREPGVFGADPVSTAQINFISSLVGLSIAVANVDGHVKVSQIEALKSFMRQSFSFGPEDQDLLQKIIDETFKNRYRIDIEGLCYYYRAVSGLQDRVLLLRLLFKIALADRDGVTVAEENLISRIAFLLGVDGQTYSAIKAEFAREDSDRYYKILGVDRTASVEEIKAAYRHLVQQYHPDKVANLGEEFIKVAEEKFKIIQEAYRKIREERGF